MLRNERRRQNSMEKVRSATEAAAVPGQHTQFPQLLPPLKRKRKRMPTHKGAAKPLIPRLQSLRLHSWPPLLTGPLH